MFGGLSYTAFTLWFTSLPGNSSPIPIASVIHFYSNFSLLRASWSWRYAPSEVTSTKIGVNNSQLTEDVSKCEMMRTKRKGHNWEMQWKRKHSRAKRKTLGQLSGSTSLKTCSLMIDMFSSLGSIFAIQQWLSIPHPLLFARNVKEIYLIYSYFKLSN